jgi:hypothetical protein
LAWFNIATQANTASNLAEMSATEKRAASQKRYREKQVGMAAGHGFHQQAIF